MNDLEHQYMFAKVISTAIELTIDRVDMTQDELKKECEKVLLDLWSNDLAKNLNKRGVMAELAASISVTILEK